MQLREIMTRSVETIDPDASLRLAASRMEAENVGFLPVMHGSRLVGVITDRDITIRSVSKGLNPEKTTVRQAMTDHIVALPENCDLEDAADLMERQQVRRLVVTGQDDGPVGVVSLDKLAVYIGRYGTGEAGLSGDEIQGPGFEGEAVAGNREFPEKFEPARQAVDGAEPTAIGTDPSVTTESEIVERDARDQSDPRHGPRTLERHPDRRS